MFIKRIKYIVIVLGVMFLIFRLSIFIFRLPSYTIQTSGKLYVVSKLTEDIQVFNLSTGEEIADIPIDILSHEAIATTDEKKVVATDYGSNEGNIMKVINTATNEVEKIIDLKEDIRVNGIVALSEPQKVAVIDYLNNNLLVVNIATNSIEKQINTEQQKSHLIVVHPNKNIVYVTNIDSGSISVIDLNLSKVIKIIPCGLGRKGIAITPDGSEIWVTNTKLNSITVINTLTNEITDTLKSGQESLKLNFSKDGKYCLIVNATDGVISVYNQQSKTKIKTINLHGKNTLIERILYHTPRPVNILMHPNGLYAFVANSNANKIEVIDMKTFKIVSTIGTGKVPDAMVFIK